MKIYVFLLNFFILLGVSEQFENEIQQLPISKLIAEKSRGKSFSLFSYVKENYLLYNLMLNKERVRRIDNTSDGCLNAIEYLMRAPPNETTFQFLDAWGSIPSGLLYGHLTDFGNFKECLSARTTIDEINNEIIGKYFLVKFSLFINNIFDVPQLDMSSFRVGTCFPNNCSNENVLNIFRASIERLGYIIRLDPKITMNISIPFSRSGDETKEFNAANIIAISIFSILGALMLASTLYDYMMMKLKVPPNQLLIAFSILTNGRKLFHIDTESRENNIDCLNGIRLIGMFLIIYGHSVYFFSTYPLINSIAIVDFAKSSNSLVSQFAPLAVDIFLLISGLLITWVALPKMDKMRSKWTTSVPIMYLHRYIRLTPVLAGLLLFVVGIWPLMDRGPPGPFDWYFNLEICQKHWWQNLLYINNYFKPQNMCLGNTWYLSADMQLFLFSPFIIMGLLRWKSKFLWFLLGISVLSYGCCIMTMLENDLKDIIFHGIINYDQLEKIHFPTHLRIPTWLMGVALGYWMLTYRNNKTYISKKLRIVGWIVALLLFATVFYIPYHFSKDLSPSTALEASMFTVFGRLAWSLVISWIILMCHMGYCRTLNSLLSYAGLKPIVRLTFAMYLISYPLQSMNAFLARTDHYFSTYNFFQNFCCDLLFTMACAVIVVLALESPVIAIEKYLQSGKQQKNQINS